MKKGGGHGHGQPKNQRGYANFVLWGQGQYFQSTFLKSNANALLTSRPLTREALVSLYAAGRRNVTFRRITSPYLRKSHI